MQASSIALTLLLSRLEREKPPALTRMFACAQKFCCGLETVLKASVAFCHQCSIMRVMTL